MDAETIEPKIVIMMDPAYLIHEDDGLPGSAALAPRPASRQASDRPRPESTLSVVSFPRLNLPSMLRVRS
jgi:hypothetical protein